MIFCRFFVMLFALLIGVQQAAAADVPSFDPDQPFRESLSTHLLRSMLNRALDVLEEHVQIEGGLSSADPRGDQKGHLELKLFPKGKSKSEDHVKAEGWFSISPDSGVHDFHFRFKNPHERRTPDSNSPAERL